MPGKSAQRIPVDWGVETIVDAWVLLSHQHHNNQCYICWPQRFKSFWPISRTSIVEGSTGHREPARCVDGQLPIDKELITFTLQHQVVEGDVEFLYVDEH